MSASISPCTVAQGNIRQLFGERWSRRQANPNVLSWIARQLCHGRCVLRRAFPERFIDLGIAEQNAVSFAAGLAGWVCAIVPLFACFSRAGR